MVRVRRSSVITCITSIALLICLCVWVLPTGHTQAQSERGVGEPQSTRSENRDTDWPNENPSQGDKISPDLRAQIEAHTVGNDFVTLGVKKEDVKKEDEVTRAIVQLSRPATTELDELLSGDIVSEKGRFSNLNAIFLEMRFADVKLLASFKEVDYISLDRDVEMQGHVRTTTGAAAMLRQTGNHGINGNSIAIAVLDSGIYKDHEAFKARIAASLDFTGSGKPDDV
jgi:subtilisin family serine protease